MTDQDPFASISEPLPASDPFASIAQAPRAQPVQSPTIPSDASLYWRALTNPVGEGLKSATSPLGAFEQIGGQAIKGAAAIPNMLMHPVDTLSKISPWLPGGDADSSPLQPIKDAANGLAAGNLLPAENLAGQTLGAVEGGRAAAGGVKQVLPNVPGVASARQYIRPATSVAVVSPEMQAASGLAKAINPPGGIPAGMEDSLAAQTPGILDHATRTGNPLNTRWELARAALGHGQELNDFFDNEILGPSKDRPVPMDGTGYQGEGANGKATLGQIDARLSKINKLISPAYEKNSANATITALEKTGLQDEANALRTKLYGELSKDSGLSPDEIKQLRQSYGQSYDIASKTDAARRRVGPGGVLPTTKEGLIKSVLENVVGGRDAIADRGVQSALQRFKPATSPIADWQARAAAARSQAATAAAANQAAAQQEVVHGAGLDQSAQDAATARSDEASTARQAVRTASQSRNAAPLAEGPTAPKAPLPGPDTHAFDPAAWKRENPSGNVDAAIWRARKNGYKIIDR